MNRRAKTGWLAAAMLGLSMQGFSQYRGDDDGILMQQAARRDSAAIADAVNGWWKVSMKDHSSRITWWREAKFGCFIHWGVYSVPGGEWKGKKVGGYAEHLMRKEKISRKEYEEKLIRTFNPTEFDAEAWVKLIKEAGMKYLVITAKHHDGVAMYPSAIGDYTIACSAFPRDPMQELADACKRHGIRFGFYYSHAFDWEHPDAPGNDWDYNNPGGDKNLFGGTNWYDHHPELVPKAVKYVNEKSIPQIRELLKKYHPDIIWFDTPHKLPLSENIRILQAIREVDPGVVVNGRLARSAAVSFGDYKNTADRPTEFYPVEGDWEAIPTTNESYGYSRFDDSHKPLGFFIQLMAKAAAKGGNLLMNIGPMGNGLIDPRDTLILHGIGQWMSKYGESIYGTTALNRHEQYWGVMTRKGAQEYLHVFHWPANGRLVVNGISEIKNAALLGNRELLQVKKIAPARWEIVVPAVAPDPYNSVVKITTTGGEEPVMPRLLATSGQANTLLAFDAEQQGKGWAYGDGKAAKYYVHRWSSPTQALRWQVSTTEAVRYKVKIKYAADAGTEGVYRVLADGKGGEYVVKPAAKGESIVEQELEDISLAPGNHVLQIAPVRITGKELMKLFEITLTPAGRQ
ncbi:alpha-L-fucosidase [Chitinophaga alhagiae]|nr:alpha-L-fucosidase [Chitinophaga alhagiae]